MQLSNYNSYSFDRITTYEDAQWSNQDGHPHYKGVISIGVIISISDIIKDIHCGTKLLHKIYAFQWACLIFCALYLRYNYCILIFLSTLIQIFLTQKKCLSYSNFVDKSTNCLIIVDMCTILFGFK